MVVDDAVKGVHQSLVAFPQCVVVVVPRLTGKNLDGCEERNQHQEECSYLCHD